MSVTCYHLKLSFSSACTCCMPELLFLSINCWCPWVHWEFYISRATSQFPLMQISGEYVTRYQTLTSFVPRGKLLGRSYVEVSGLSCVKRWTQFHQSILSARLLLTSVGWKKSMLDNEYLFLHSTLWKTSAAPKPLDWNHRWCLYINFYGFFILCQSISSVSNASRFLLELRYPGRWAVTVVDPMMEDVCPHLSNGTPWILSCNPFKMRGWSRFICTEGKWGLSISYRTKNSSRLILLLWKVWASVSDLLFRSKSSPRPWFCQGRFLVFNQQPKAEGMTRIVGRISLIFVIIEYLLLRVTFYLYFGALQDASCSRHH